MILGCHLSVAGGPHKALELAAELGLDAVAMFIRQHRQWRAAALTDAAIELFQATRAKLKIDPLLGHGSNQLNQAGEEPVRSNSIVAIADELDRANRLGVDAYVFHPGSTGTAGRNVGIQRVADALNQVAAGMPELKTNILLESTAGAGNLLGATFGSLADILAKLERPELFGVCLDTCHLFASGYDIRSAEAYEGTMADFDRVVGRGRLLAIHLNDSLKHLGSCLDRHAHIGFGQIGLEGFAHFATDKRLAKLPMILETPKGYTKDGREWDAVNATTMRALAAGKKPKLPESDETVEE
jgi:deoxyribonuclease IV